MNNNVFKLFRKGKRQGDKEKEHSLPINEREHYTDSIESKKFKDILVVPVSAIKKNLHLKNVNKKNKIKRI